MTATMASPSPVLYLVLSLVQIGLSMAGLLLLLLQVRQVVDQLAALRAALAHHQRTSDDRLQRLEEALPEAPTPVQTPPAKSEPVALSLRPRGRGGVGMRTT